jgi:predicted nucleic acid-binding Zn ribbon protein
MYCATCGTPVAPGLSFCNRCGASLKERSSTSQPSTMAAFLTAITLIAICGLGIMLGGALVLKREAQMGEDIVGIFMLMTFLLVGTVEVFLCRQLSRLSGKTESPAAVATPAASVNELRAPEQRVLPEPIPSVTENTTRTLEYSRNEPLRR